MANDRQVKDYLKRLGNPYASLQVCEMPAEDAPRVESAHLRSLENPYAFAPTDEASESQSPNRGRVLDTPPLRQTLSKAGFRDGCTRIFRQYIPQIERGRLRASHKAFISRNEAQPAGVRHAMLAELQKYDLSDVAGLQLRFNREREDMTDEKLKRIEASVLSALR